MRRPHPLPNTCPKTRPGADAYPDADSDIEADPQACPDANADADPGGRAGAGGCAWGFWVFVAGRAARSGGVLMAAGSRRREIRSPVQGNEARERAPQPDKARLHR